MVYAIITEVKSSSHSLSVLNLNSEASFKQTIFGSVEEQNIKV